MKMKKMSVALVFVFIFCLVRGAVLQDESEGYSEGKDCNKESGCNNLNNAAVALKSKNDSDVGCKIRRGLRIESLVCFGATGYLDCSGVLPVGTLVSFLCPPYYKANTPGKISMCKKGGSWSVPVECIPECGITSPAAVPLIMNGKDAALGQFPWAAALYLRFDNQWSFNCGGTLISDNTVITAAHCTWNIKKENMKIALGITMRTLPENHENLQVFKVKRVYILPVFREATNYYNSDIAILVLESSAQLSDSVLPACLPDPGNVSVTPFTSGVVAGWGMNEKREPPVSLKYMKVPIIDIVKCMKHVPQQFTKFMAFTSFCAGYINGTGACNGDSGNGLLTQTNDRWVLQGVVSISPRRGTSRYCHPRNYSLYTKVMLYVSWILKVLDFEEKKTLQEQDNQSI